MDFSAKITEYKESNSSKSPVWIWFDNEKEYGKCQICKTRVKIVNYATTNLILHLKCHHGFLKELEVDNSKQPKIGDVIAPPYGPEHPRQQALTNAIAQMICVDAMPVSTVSRKGFQNCVLIVAAKATYDTLSIGRSASDTLLWALLSSH